MKLSLAISCLLFGCSSAFSVRTGCGRIQPNLKASTSPAEAVAISVEQGKNQDPLLIRAARGEKVDRTPVWMMRQAGRHIKEYRDLCQKYPTFRQRSEIPEVAVEVSLQPWRNYKTDGCILFSDILTPLPGMGCEFVIDEKLGPIMDPIKSYDDAKKVSSNRCIASSVKMYFNSPPHKILNYLFALPRIFIDYSCTRSTLPPLLRSLRKPYKLFGRKLALKLQF